MSQNPAIPAALGLAGQHLQAGDAAAAGRVLTPLLDRFPADPRLLHLSGVTAMHQQRHADAAELFQRARAANPGEPVLAFSHGTALRWLERHVEAAEAFADAYRLNPHYAEAYFEAAATLEQLGRQEDAESVYRQWLKAMPGHARGKQALADLLLDMRRPQEAEPLLQQVLLDAIPPAMRADVHRSLGLALYRQSKNAQALEQCEKSAALATSTATDAIRAEILQRFRRYDEAARLSASLVAREPENPQWHKLHNDLMYRLGSPDYLKSFEHAPKSVELLLSKAYFLAHEKRAEEAHQAYREVLALEPDNKIAGTGLGNTFAMMKQHGEALAVLEGLLARHNDDPNLLISIAETAVEAGDPQKAAAFCERSIAIQPHDQVALAVMGTAWRLMKDERDETLNGYDSLIRIFDLEPPEGFSDMAGFNAELNSWLDRIHPATREYLEQSLRNGTQTADKLFGVGHDLVERLQRRIHEAVGRYIAEMKADDRHPLLSRRARDYDYTGSWSSRLRDCGFHTNHIHPEGWISSCYYVALPRAVEDTQSRQGWIKFGEPALDVTLKEPIRRAIQPRPGRLVLFPSYMWHGTIPFHDSEPRTTIAFDVVPKD